MIWKNKFSAMIIDKDKTTRDYISKALDRIGIPHSNIEDESLLLKLVKKSFFGKLNYNFFIINNNMPDKNESELIKQLNEKYGKKIMILVVIEKENELLRQKYYQDGASMVIPFEVFQSYLFNWYMNLTQGKIIIRDAEEGKYSFKDKTVMVVEDNVLNREITCNLLENVGLKVVIAIDGVDAVEKFKASNHDEISLILMDIQMPRMNGYTATETIRNLDHPDSHKVPIIAMTANCLPEDINKAKEYHMNGYIIKPISTKKLYDNIAKFIRQ